MKSDTEKSIEWYVDSDFADGWNQENDKDPVLVLSRTGYVISYSNWPIIWARQTQT